MIEISHLTKRYGEHVAVDDLSITIESGKIYGFLGPNGAGKSTTMNMITGYLAATEGTVKINGFDILKQPEQARKCVGYLPEIPPLYTDMTVGEYLKFVADLKKIQKNKKKQMIAESMELTKITDMKDRLIRNLSKGYRQRVGFAQAVLGYPQVIILDEPTVGLDPKQMIEIRELIQNLGERHTVILSSHILTEVKEICEHIFILSKGRLAASDTTENLINRASGDKEMHLLMKGRPDAAAAVFQKAGLFVPQIAPAQEAGCCQAVFKIGQNRQNDMREQIFYAFADARIPILEMHVGSKSLEEVFLELTNQSTEKLSSDETELDVNTNEKGAAQHKHSEKKEGVTEHSALEEDAAENSALEEDAAENSALEEDETENSALKEDETENSVLKEDETENSVLEKGVAKHSTLEEDIIEHSTLKEDAMNSTSENNTIKKDNRQEVGGNAGNMEKGV